LPRPGRRGPVDRRRVNVRVGLPRTVARQHNVGRGPQTRRPRRHVRASRDHRRSVRLSVQSANVLRGDHVQRVVRGAMGQRRMEVRAAVRLGQSSHDRRRQSPVVPEQVPRLSAAQESHYTVFVVNGDVLFLLLVSSSILRN